VKHAASSGLSVYLVNVEKGCVVFDFARVEWDGACMWVTHWQAGCVCQNILCCSRYSIFM